MGIGSWLRRLLAPTDAEEETALREELGGPDPGLGERERDRRAPFAAAEAAEAAEDDLGELEPPRDPEP